MSCRVEVCCFVLSRDVQLLGLNRWEASLNRKGALHTELVQFIKSRMGSCEPVP